MPDCMHQVPDAYVPDVSAPPQRESPRDRAVALEGIRCRLGGPWTADAPPSEHATKGLHYVMRQAVPLVVDEQDRVVVAAAAEDDDQSGG